MRSGWLILALICFSITASGAVAADVTDLKAEVEKLRREINSRESSNTLAASAADCALCNRFGPNEKVTTNSGKLEISGLTQVWFQQVQQDHHSVEAQPLNFPTSGGSQLLSESNEGADNATFRIRRTELRFKYDVDDHTYGYFMMDPAREASAGFLPLPTFARHNSVLGPLVDQNLPSTRLLQTGEILSKDVQPHLLQDAYIVYHDVVPHHTFKIGQFKPPGGDESGADSGYLDFAERAMVTGISNVRDLGVQAAGTWLDGRVQYALGLFDGPTGTILSDPEITEAGNRPDDHNGKDFSWRIQLRPFYDVKKWYGRFELGYARTDGTHGSQRGAGEFDPDFGVSNSMNNQLTAVNRQDAWGYYRPSGPHGELLGWWIRGEWGSARDRFGRGANTSLLGLGSVDLGVQGPRGGSAFTQANPTPVTVQGWFVSTGYKLSESPFGASLAKGGQIDKMLNRTEFAFRYEVYQNITTEDLVLPDRHSAQFKTSVYTTGINYYMQGNYNKVQLNYMIVDDPVDKAHFLRQVNNNVFVVNFQLGF